MKKTLFLLCTLWCGWQYAAAQKQITIKGVIRNPGDKRVLVANLSASQLEPKQNIKEATLADDGSFTVDIPATEAYNWMVILNGRQRSDFMAPIGAQLTLNVDGSQWEQSIQFAGKGKEVPEFFTRYTLERGLTAAYSKNSQEAGKLEPGAYEKVLDSLMVAEYAYLDKKKATIPKEFYTYWKDYIRYMNYSAMLMYPIQHEMFRQNTNNIRSIAPELYVVAKKVPAAFDDKFLTLGPYQTYVESFFPARLNAAGFTNVIRMDPATRAEDRSQALQQTDSILNMLYRTTPKKTAELMAAKTIFAGMPGWTTQEMEQRLAAYKREFPKSPNNAVLEGGYKDAKKFNPGEPAIDFAFTTLEGKPMKLSDLKGKVVYMDFWASWCGPCKGEMPYAKKLKEHFKDQKDVVFLYVSIDDKEEAWKKGIEAMDISGIHTRTPGWQGEITLLYGITGVPSYFLIDKKGNFVLKKTPRPSQSEELQKEIEKLL